jgi:TRAP-type uncharacterized transport system fused permease subunit
MKRNLLFYFGIVADLTPPVALAAYAGAAIARANPMKTAFTATKLAIGAFIVPYVFALNPAMLFINTNAWEVILICITSCVGIFAVSASLEGYFMHNMSWYERVVSAVGGLLLIYPGIVTDVIGLALVGVVLVVQMLTKKKNHQKHDEKIFIYCRNLFCCCNPYILFAGLGYGAGYTNL